MAGGLIGWFEDVGGEIAEAVVDFSQWYTRAMGLNALWDWMMPDVPEIEYPGVKLNKTGTDLPLPLIYGTRRVGGVIVFKAVDPADTGILHQVIVLGEGEVFSIGDVYLGDDLSTDPKFSGLVTITKYNGTTTQAADADLVATFPDYTVATRLKGVAYLHVKLTYNRDVFRGIPIVTADVMGKRVLDLHLGAETYSTNPAWVLRDYLLSPTYGKGLPASAIDEASFSDAALACDVLMPSYAGSGVNIRTFETNAVVNTNRSVSANITALLAQCRGNLVYTGGKYRLEIEGTKASTFSLNADNILSRSGVKSGGKRSRLNGVKVEFTNPLTDWEKDYAITSSATMLAEDGGLILETTVNRPFETSPYRAQYIAETLVKKSRESILATFLVNHSALAVEVADIVDVTHASLGWASKLFRVVAVEIRPDLTVGLALAEYEPTTYDRTIPASAFVSPPNTSLADPTVVQPPTGLTISSGTPHLLTMGDGSIISRAKLTWAASTDPYLDHYEVQGSKAPSGSWSDVPPVTTTTVAAYMGSVQDGQAYFFRVRAVNTAGVPSAWVTSAQHTVLGKQDAPGTPINVAYATTADGRRRLTWQMGIIEPDLAGFQIRYFAGVGGNWNTAIDLHAGLVSVDPNVAINTDFSYEFDHLPAGSYEFFVRPWDTSGLTSIAPGSVTGVTLPVGPSNPIEWGNVLDGAGTRPADNADITGAVLEGTGGLLYNWNLSIANAAGKPSGLRGVENVTDQSGIAFGNAARSWVQIAHATDANIAYGFPAIPIDDAQTYEIIIRHRSVGGGLTGFYLRMNELAGAIGSGATHVGTAANAEPVVAQRTGIGQMSPIVSNAPFPGTVWQTDTYTYRPTAGTRVASFTLYNWTATTETHEVDYVQIHPTVRAASGVTYADGTAVETLQPVDAGATAGAIWGVNVGGANLPSDNATVGATWNTDVAGQPTVDQWRNQLLDPTSWVIGSGGTQGVNTGNGDVVSYFGRNGLTSENNIVSGLDQAGREVPLWQCSPSGDSNGDGGWNSGSFNIDPNRAYRYSVWVKRTLSNDGSTYLGLYAYNNVSTSIGVVNILTSITNTNAYFFAGMDLPILDRWYLVVGYVHGLAHTGTASLGAVYDGVTGGKVFSTQDYKWLPNTATSLHRAYLYYAAAATSKQYFVHPRVDLIDGNEPSVAALLGLADVTQTVIDTGILTTGAVWMNSGTFGAKGIQAEYNNGTPRLHVGDGANSFLKHDGALLTWKATNTELDAAGNLTATNATFDNVNVTNANVSGAITVGAGSSGIANLSDAGAFATLNQITSANIGSYIADLSVNTLHIADNAVTIPYSDYVDPAVDLATVAVDAWQAGTFLTAPLVDSPTIYTVSAVMAANTALSTATEQVIEFSLGHWLQWSNNWIPSTGQSAQPTLQPSTWYKPRWGDCATFRETRRFLGPWKPNMDLARWPNTYAYSFSLGIADAYPLFLIDQGPLKGVVFACTNTAPGVPKTESVEPTWTNAWNLGSYLSPNGVVGNTYQNWGQVGGISVNSYNNYRKKMTTGGFFSSMLLTSTTMRK